MNRIRQVFAALLLVLLLPKLVWAQQSTVTAPMHRVSDGFHENIGIGFGFRLPGQYGIFFRNRSPASGAVTGPSGFSLQGPMGGLGYFNVSGDQGSTRGLTSVAPSVTVMNGGHGMIQDVQLRPFVIGVVPVVGGFGPAYGAAPLFGPTPLPAAAGGLSILDERLTRMRQEGVRPPKTVAGPQDQANDKTIANKAGERKNDPLAERHAAAAASSAGVPAQSIADIRRQQLHEESADSDEAGRLLSRGQELEREGKIDLAKLYYQRAFSKASAPVRDAARDALQRLNEKSPSRK